jgi:hypothetical protein
VCLKTRLLWTDGRAPDQNWPVFDHKAPAEGLVPQRLFQLGQESGENAASTAVRNRPEWRNLGRQKTSITVFYDVLGL